MDQLSDLKENYQSVSHELKQLKERNNFNIQKVGMVRFNPFKETGSDQSFSVAFLDNNDSGAVITSLYPREESRVYGKPIKNGNSNYPLSKEEVLAIERAKNPEKNIASNSVSRNLSLFKNGKKIKKNNGSK